MYKNLEKFGITLQDVADAMGYSTVHSLRNSTAKDRVLEGVDELIGRVRKWYVDEYREKYLDLFDE